MPDKKQLRELAKAAKAAKAKAEYDAYVKSIVDQAPPLTAAQCATLSRIMLPPGWSFVPPTPAADDLNET